MTTICCPYCHEEKSIEAFGRAKWRKEGISYRCKACNSRNMKDWARRNPDKVKAKNEASYAKWRSENPVREPFLTLEGRLCRVCQQRKPDEHFVLDKRGPGGFGWRCKECAKVALRRWNESHPHRIRRRGFDNDALKKMWVRQDGKCAICSEPIIIDGNRKHGRAAHLDHCHRTNEIRDLLCPPCNVGLGGFRDSIQFLASAIEYLRRHSV